jgi:hypothetical protein
MGALNSLITIRNDGGTIFQAVDFGGICELPFSVKTGKGERIALFAGTGMELNGRNARRERIVSKDGKN